MTGHTANQSKSEEKVFICIEVTSYKIHTLEVNLFLIKSGYHIVPSPSTALPLKHNRPWYKPCGHILPVLGSSV